MQKFGVDRGFWQLLGMKVPFRLTVSRRVYVPQLFLIIGINVQYAHLQPCQEPSSRYRVIRYSLILDQVYPIVGATSLCVSTQGWSVAIVNLIWSARVVSIRADHTAMLMT